MSCDVHGRSMHVLHSLRLKHKSSQVTINMLQAELTSFKHQLQTVVRLAASALLECVCDYCMFLFIILSSCLDCCTRHAMPNKSVTSSNLTIRWQSIVCSALCNSLHSCQQLWQHHICIDGLKCMHRCLQVHTACAELTLAILKALTPLCSELKQSIFKQAQVQTQWPQYLEK